MQPENKKYKKPFRFTDTHSIIIYYWQEHKWLVEYCLIGEHNKHLNLKTEIDNLQRKRFLKMIKWYTC